MTRFEIGDYVVSKTERDDNFDYTMQDGLYVSVNEGNPDPDTNRTFGMFKDELKCVWEIADILTGLSPDHPMACHNVVLWFVRTNDGSTYLGERETFVHINSIKHFKE